MTGWQPIETAPRDGTWVLLTGGHTDECSMWDDLSGYVTRCVVAKWQPKFWAMAYWDGEWRSEYLHPTHRQPLPEPPK